MPLFRIYHDKWKLEQQIPGLLLHKVFLLQWATIGSHQLYNVHSASPLCHNIYANRSNIINVIHGNSRNPLNSSNNFHIVRVYPRAYDTMRGPVMKSFPTRYKKSDGLQVQVCRVGG